MLIKQGKKSRILRDDNNNLKVVEINLKSFRLSKIKTIEQKNKLKGDLKT